MEMWFFEEDFEIGELSWRKFFWEVFCFVDLIFRKWKDQKKVVEVFYEPKKRGDPNTSKLNLDYLALLMVENLYRNMYSLFIPWQGCIYDSCILYINISMVFSLFHPCVGLIGVTTIRFLIAFPSNPFLLTASNSAFSLISPSYYNQTRNVCSTQFPL